MRNFKKQLNTDFTSIKNRKCSTVDLYVALKFPMIEFKNHKR